MQDILLAWSRWEFSLSALGSATLVFALFFVGFPAFADDPYFEILEVKNLDRSAAADLADLNGDGLYGSPCGGSTGSASPGRARCACLPPGSGGGSFLKSRAMCGRFRSGRRYTIWPISGRTSPGSELILLRPGGLTILSLAAEIAPRWDLDVSGPTTTGVGADERGFEYFKLVHEGFGPEPLLFCSADRAADTS